MRLVLAHPAAVRRRLRPAGQTSRWSGRLLRSLRQRGDGDIFVDNGEQATFSVDLSNIGSSSSTDVKLVSASSPSHPEFTLLTPLDTVFAATLSSCGVANAPIDFLAGGLSDIGEPVTIQVQLTSDQLGALTIVQEFHVREHAGGPLSSLTPLHTNSKTPHAAVVT